MVEFWGVSCGSRDYSEFNKVLIRVALWLYLGLFKL